MWYAHTSHSSCIVLNGCRSEPVVPQNVSRIHIGLENIGPNTRLPQGGNRMRGRYFGNMGDLTKTRYRGVDLSA